MIYSGCFDYLKDEEETPRFRMIQEYYSIKKDKDVPKKENETSKFMELVGMMLMDWDYIDDEYNCMYYVTMDNFDSVANGTEIEIAGIVINSREHSIKKSGKKMGFVTLQQNERSINLIIWNDFWEDNKNKFKKNSVVLFKGMKDMDSYRKVESVYSSESSYIKKIEVQ